MSITSDLVFNYTFLLCVITLICAVPVYGMMRRKTPQLGWHRYGNVSTEPFLKIDLIGIAIILLIFAALLTLSQASPELAADDNIPEEMETNPALVILAMVSQQVAFIFVIVALLIYRGTNVIELFGLRWKKAYRLFFIAPIGLILALAFVVALGLAGYNEWLQYTFGSDSKLQETVVFYQNSDIKFRAMIAFVVVIMAPLSEEIIFRGYIYAATKRFSDRFFAASFSSLLFAVVHHNINALLPLFFLALILVLAYELTGSLWAPMSIHALFNATTLMMLEIQIASN